MKNTLSIDADLLSLRAIAPWIAETLTNNGRDLETLYSNLELAVQEICVNVVKYAYQGHDGHRITLDMAVDDRTVTVTTTDSGVAFNPTDRPKVDLDSPTIGGYGLFLVEQLCESANYERLPDGNRWTLTFARTAQVDA